jgi:hypothetical protein
MVVSYSNNFIFLRVPKNASSSLAEYFVRNKCNKEIDMWTSVNDCGIKENKVPKDVIKKYAYHYRHIHLTLQELVDNALITPTEASDMTKIVVMRNPLHRQLSLFFFLCRNQKRNNTPEEFRKMFANGKHESDTNNVYTQTEYAKLDGVIADNVDFWKYEDIGLKISDKLSTFKSNTRPKKDIDKLVVEYYDDATRQAVLDYYAEDMKIYESLHS